MAAYRVTPLQFAVLGRVVRVFEATVVALGEDCEEGCSSDGARPCAFCVLRRDATAALADGRRVLDEVTRG